MIQIATASPLDWSDNRSGTGVITKDQTVANIQTASLTGVTEIYKSIPARAGELITLRVMARRISGSNDASGVISISYPSSAPTDNSVEIRSSGWQKYSISFAIPHTANLLEFVYLSIGIGDGALGEIEVSEIEILVENGSSPFARIHAAAFINITLGVPEINGSFFNCGVTNLTFLSGARLEVEVLPINSSQGFSPLTFIDIGVDNNLNLVAKAGEYDRETGKIIVKFIDTTTGLEVDVSTNPKIFLNFMLVGS